MGRETRPARTLTELTFAEAALEDRRRALAMSPGDRVQLVAALLAVCLSTRGLRELPRLRRVIRILNRHRVRFVVIGGYAVAFHGLPRATDDVDVLIDREPSNVLRAEKALLEFAGTAPRKQALRQRGGVVRIGGPVTHIDVTTKVDGIGAVGPVWARRVPGDFLGERTSYISAPDLLRTKRAANRPKDQGDIAFLVELLAKRPRGS